MENKYYTPKIEEFRVGFEYQELEFIYTDKGWYTAKEQKWLNKTFEATNYMESHYLTEIVKRGMYTNSIRVKYLDQTDIEELGFKLKAIRDTYSWYEYWNNNEDICTELSLYNKSIKIIKYEKDKYTNGSNRLDSNGNQNYIVNNTFRGYIKNKSELSILLQQLGIVNHS